MDRQEAKFWLTVGLVAVASVALFKIGGARFGDRIPALGQLAAFI